MESWSRGLHQLETLAWFVLLVRPSLDADGRLEERKRCKCVRENGIRAAAFRLPFQCVLLLLRYCGFLKIGELPPPCPRTTSIRNGGCALWRPQIIFGPKLRGGGLFWASSVLLLGLVSPLCVASLACLCLSSSRASVFGRSFCFPEA